MICKCKVRESDTPPWVSPAYFLQAECVETNMNAGHPPSPFEFNLVVDGLAIRGRLPRASDHGLWLECDGVVRVFGPISTTDGIDSRKIAVVTNQNDHTVQLDILQVAGTQTWCLDSETFRMWDAPRVDAHGVVFERIQSPIG